MATATLPVAMQKRIQAEINAEREAERQTALAALQATEEHLEEITPQHEAKISEARASLSHAREMATRLVLDATADLRAAEVERQQAVGSIERRRDSLRCRLETDLMPVVIRDALAAIERYRESIPAPATGIDDQGRVKGSAKESIDAHSWCAVATRKLLELRFSSGDVDQAVQNIMAGRPTMQEQQAAV